MITWLKYLHEALIIHPKGDEMKAEARELIKEYEKLQDEVKRLEKYELFAWACPMCGNHDPNFFGVKRWASYGRAYEYSCLKCKWRSGTCIKEESLLEALVVERVKRGAKE